MISRQQRLARDEKIQMMYEDLEHLLPSCCVGLGIVPLEVSQPPVLMPEPGRPPDANVASLSARMLSTVRSSALTNGKCACDKMSRLIWNCTQIFTAMKFKPNLQNADTQVVVLLDSCLVVFI